MCRRTTRVNDGRYHAMNDNLAVQKLGAIEDIESRLGIDMVTLFAALREGVYVKNCQTGKIMPILRGFFLSLNYNSEKDVVEGFYDERSFNQKTIEIDCTDGIKRKLNVQSFYPFSEYGKTWSMKKEDLE